MFNVIVWFHGVLLAVLRLSCSPFQNFLISQLALMSSNLIVKISRIFFLVDTRNLLCCRMLIGRYKGMNILAVVLSFNIIAYDLLLLP